MSILTMDMASFKELQNDFTVSEYSEEVLYSGWVPTLTAQQSVLPHWESLSIMPDDLVNVDTELFLRKMYNSQR